MRTELQERDQVGILLSLRLHDCLCGLMAHRHKNEQFLHLLFRSKNFLNHELLFDSESAKDKTSSLPDIFPQKFNYISIELQGDLRRKQFEAFSRS